MKRRRHDVLLVLLFWLGALEFKILKFLFFCCLNIFLGNFPRFSVHKSLKTKANSKRARTPVFLVYYLQKAKANNQSVTYLKPPAFIIGNLRTTTKFTTTTSVAWEKTGTRTSVSAGKRKLTCSR